MIKLCLLFLMLGLGSFLSGQTLESGVKGALTDQSTYKTEVAMRSSNPSGVSIQKPVLYRSVSMPEQLLASDKGLKYGGDVRVGDLTGNGSVDFVVYRTKDGTKPCFIGAFTMDGEVIWQVGTGGGQPVRPGPVVLYDVTGNGRDEVICFFATEELKGNPGSNPLSETMADVVIQIRDGLTGEVLRENAPEQLVSHHYKNTVSADWVFQRIFVANFRGKSHPRDFMAKVGTKVYAFNDKLEVLWTYDIPEKWGQGGGQHSAYQPAVGDIDGDGRDELTGGHYLLNHDGTPLWEKTLGLNMDCVTITEWDAGNLRVIASGGGYVLDQYGNEILKLGEDVIPHGQELRVADFIADSSGPEMVIRYKGHSRYVMLVSNSGDIVNRFRINHSPRHVGPWNT